MNNASLIDNLHMLRGILQAGDMAQAQALLSELLVRAEADALSAMPVDRSIYAGRWLERLLDEEHKLLLARIDDANDDEILALERHVEERKGLLDLALNAGDLAGEIARTYELLSDSDGAENLVRDERREIA